MALPTGLSYFRIQWKALAGIADGLDADDEPDIVPTNGTVTFTPEISSLTLLGDDAASFFLEPVTASLQDGVLKSAQGANTVPLISPFSSGLVEKGWTWTATFKVNGYTKASFPFQGQPGQTYNLAVLTPVILTPTTITVKGDPGAPGAPGPAGYSVDATATVKGVVALAGDLGGTADAPTVPAMVRKSYVDAIGTADATPNTVVRRDATGWIGLNGVYGLNAPQNSADAVNKAYVDTGLSGKANTVHTHTASQLSDATTVGKALIAAVDASSARTTIGAGTSNLALGSTSTTAAAGNHTHTAAAVGAVAVGTGIATITQLTQAAYDALGTKVASTLYVIVG